METGWRGGWISRARLALAAFAGALLWIALLATPGAGAAQSSSFPTDDEGWMMVGSPHDSFDVLPATYYGAGGNPGGYISAPGDASISSPTSWAGDQSDAYSGWVTLDYRYSGSADLTVNTTLTDNSGDSLTTWYGLDAAGAAGWRSESFPLSVEDGWFPECHRLTCASVEDPAVLRATLASLRSLTVFMAGGVVRGIEADPGAAFDVDNVALAPPQPVHRSITIKHEGHHFEGKLALSSPFPPPRYADKRYMSGCLEQMPVSLFAVKKGPDRKLGSSDLSKKSDHSYRVHSKIVGAKVYTVAKPRPNESGGYRCKAARSKTLNIPADHRRH